MGFFEEIRVPSEEHDDIEDLSDQGDTCKAHAPSVKLCSGSVLEHEKKLTLSTPIPVDGEYEDAFCRDVRQIRQNSEYLQQCQFHVQTLRA